MSDAYKKKGGKLKKDEKPISLQTFKSNPIFDQKLVSLIFSFFKPSILEENWKAFYKLENCKYHVRSDTKEKFSELKKIYDQIITDKKDQKNCLLHIDMLKNKIQEMKDGSHFKIFVPGLYSHPTGIENTQGEIDNRVTDLLDSLDNLKQTLISQASKKSHSTQSVKPF
jgi:hypothetical protein